MTGRVPLAESWPWNRAFLRLMLAVPTSVAIAATLLTWPSAGRQALWFLLAIPIGGLFYVIYGAVGARVETLERRQAAGGGDVAQALIVLGRRQSPGVVVFREGRFDLFPVVGDQQRIDPARENLVGEGRWLPGKYLWGKRVFTFRAETFDPLAFAVPESVGARWSAVLRGGGSS